MIFSTVLNVLTSVALASTPTPAKSYAEFQKADTQQAVLQLENGLEVLLVSNPRFQKSAAAMAIPSGSWADPEEHQGLAHFLEHMLFLGTRDFPEVGEYTNYLKGNGGMSNAYTARDHTNYFFEVNASAFEGALHRFSQFFVDPKLNAEFATKEKNAVNSEFDKNLRSEGWRYHTSLGLFASPGDARRKFSTGSNVTLANVDSQVLRDFYEKHYSADTMKLVLSSPLPLSEMKKLVETYFNEVPNRSLKGKTPQATILPEQSGQWLNVRSIGDENMLVLRFPVSVFAPHWATKPEQIIKSLLEREAPGSLTEALKRSNDITSLSVRADDDVNFGNSGASVSVEMDLTSKGAKNPDELIRQFFAYVGRLQSTGIQPYSFVERQVSARLALESRSVGEGMDQASEYSGQMLYFPARELDERSTLLYQYDHDLIQSYLNALTPGNLNVIRYSRDVVTDRKETPFELEVSLSKISAPQLAGFEQALNSGSTNFVYPAKNPYISDESHLYRDEVASEPQLISDNANGKTWFLQENSPITRAKADLNVLLKSPLVISSARERMLAELYANVITNVQSGVIQSFREAGYEIGLGANETGLVVAFSGLSEKMPLVVDDLLLKGSQFLKPEISEDVFANVKEEMLRGVASARLEDAFKQVMRKGAELLIAPGLSREKMHAELAALTYQDLLSFQKKFFSALYSEVLIYGNLQRSSFADFNLRLNQALGAQALSSADIDLMKRQERPTKDGEKRVFIMDGENNNNAVLSLLKTGARTPKNLALNQLFGTLLSDLYYTELRTKQQLGYVVTAAPTSGRRAPDSARIFMLIQSAKYSPNEIVKRSQKFLQEFNRDLSATLDAEFDVLKSGLIELLERKPQQMSERYDELKGLFQNENADWQYKDRILEEMKKITRPELEAFIHKSLDPKTQTVNSVYFNAPGTPVPDLSEGEILWPEPVH